MILQNDRIILRPPTMKDAGQILHWENASEVVELSDHKGGLRLADIENYIASIRDVYLDKQLRWLISKDGKSIGTIDIFDVDFEKGHAHIGILIAEDSHRRAGFGKEAFGLVKEYCQDILNLRKLIADVQSHNLGSQGFFEEMGFMKKEMQEDILRYERDIAQD